MSNYENEKGKKEKNSYEPDYYTTGMLMEGTLSSMPTKDNVAGSSISSAEAEISNVAADAPKVDLSSVQEGANLNVEPPVEIEPSLLENVVDAVKHTAEVVSGVAEKVGDGLSSAAEAIGDILDGLSL